MELTRTQQGSPPDSKRGPRLDGNFCHCICSPAGKATHAWNSIVLHTWDVPCPHAPALSRAGAQHVNCRQTIYAQPDAALQSAPEHELCVPYLRTATMARPNSHDMKCTAVELQAKLPARCSSRQAASSSMSMAGEDAAGRLKRISTAPPPRSASCSRGSL